MTTLTITLPHTPRCLSPNAKAPLTQRGAIVAGYKKTAAKSRARNIAWGRTCEALNGRRMQPTHYRVHDLDRAGQVEIVFERRDDENA